MMTSIPVSQLAGLSDQTDFTLLPFVKMHGLGNDFVLLQSSDLPNQCSLEKLAAFLCDRHFGIGADGLIVDGLPTVENDPNGRPYDIRFVYLNGDGTWAEMCGNGIRCFARFVYERGLIHKKIDQNKFLVETLAGPIEPEIRADLSVTVNMGAPILHSAQVPFKSAEVSAEMIAENISLTVLGQEVPVSALSMGNPHCLVFQCDLKTPLDPVVFGPALENHPAFPNKTNVEFLEILDPQTLRCVVWERGCGFTLACGTGACASAVSAIRHGKVTSPVTVHLPGGPLLIEWSGEGQPVYMSGPAETVFSGEVKVPSTLLQRLG